MNLKKQLLSRILLIAMVSLSLSTYFVLYRTDQQAMLEAEQTAQRIEKQMQQQLLQMFQRNDFSIRFPDINLLQQIKSIPGSCTQFLSRTQSRQRSLCNDTSDIQPDWPVWFGKLYKHFFHPDWEVKRNVNFNAIRYGTVLVSLNVQMETARAWNTLQAVVGILAVTILAFATLLFATLYHMLKPAQQIVQGLNKMREGDLDIRLPAFDVAEWKHTSAAINQLADAQQQTLADNQKLALKLINAQEEEHRYIARELHDEFGQCLAGINAVTTSIQQSAQQHYPQILPEVSSINHISSHMMTALRSLLTRLRPAEVDEIGLEASLRKLFRSWNQRSGGETQYTLNIAAPLNTLSEPLPVNIYRIVQECLTNIAKHAKARNAIVSFSHFNSKTLALTIDDDGIADPESFKAEGGIGLIGIYERVSALGGKMHVQAKQHGGLYVSVTLPLDHTGK